MPDIWMDVDIAIAEAPVNIAPLIDDTDFTSIEAAVVYNAAGMALIWHFVTTAGVMTETAVTPTTAGVHDWTDQGTSGLYALEIPASAGTINNDTEGFGWFTGVATGVLPWRGPVIGFRAAALNNALIDGGDVLDVSITELGGVAQSATDLKDFADAGYDPATNKVQGVVLTDTTTTNTDMITAGASSVTHLFVVEKDATDVSLDISILNTDGTPRTGLVYNTSGLTCYYRIGTTGTATALSLVTLATVGTAHADGGFIEIDATNADGLYRLDLSDVIVATGVDRVSIVVQGVASMQPTYINIDLVDAVTIAGGIIEANVINVNGTAQTANDNGADINTILSRIIGTLASGTHNPATAAEIATLNDWIDGNRLDLILDARMAEASINTTGGAVDTVTDVTNLHASAATSAAQTTAQNDLNIITDSDGVILGAAGVDLIWDEILTGATHNVATSAGRRLRQLQDSGLYDGGYLYIDTADGTAGVVDYENATVTNPSDSLTDAITIAASVGGLHSYYFSPDSSWTIIANLTDSVVNGYGYGIAGAGFDFSGTHILHSSPTTGIFLSATSHVDFVDGIIGAVTVNDSHFTGCTFISTTTMGAASSTVRVINGRTVTAGGCTFDFGTSAAIGHDLVANDFNGDITLSNFNNTGTDTCIITGAGRLTINASCVGGTIDVHGDWDVTDNGTATLNYDDNTTDIKAILVDTADMQPKLGTPAGADMSTDITDIPTVSEFEARTPTAAQLAYIVANAATGVPVTFTTSGGSTTAAVLDQVDGAGASSTNDQYSGRLLVFNAGTLDMVVTDITGYVGSTLTATITAIPTAPTSSHTARLI